MTNWLRYGPPRRLVCWIGNRIDRESWLHGVILNWLYPDDAVITFPPAEDE